MNKKTTSSLTLAKLSPPSLPKVLERKRLFRELDKGRPKPITWITGPPGMGKTTLAASYLKVKKVKSLWYQVDEGDADPATVFHYLGLGSKKLSPCYKQDLPHLTPEYLPELKNFTRRFFEQLFGRMKASGMLVLDNYQLLPYEDPIQELLSFGLSEIPKGIRVLVLSRMGPPPAFARMRVEQKVHIIHESSLRLTTQETKEIIQLKNNQPSSRISMKSQAESLQKYTGGWVAGVLLSLEQGEEEKADSPRINAQAPQVVFDYLAREVMDRVPKAVRNLLLRTAFCPSMTEELARQLSDNSEAGQILGDLYQRRYFIERRRENDLAYQYHPLFQEFLQNQAKCFLPPEEINNLKSTIGKYLLAQGKEEQAVALLGETECFEELIPILLSKAPVLVKQGRNRILMQWIETIPSSLREEHAWLVFWQGICLRVVDIKQSQQVLEKAFRKFHKSGDQVGSLMAWMSSVETILFQFEKFQQLDQWLNVLPEVLGEPPHYPSKELEAQVKISWLSALNMYRPNAKELSTLINEVPDLLMEIPDMSLQMLMGAHLINTLCHWGEISKSKRIVHQLRHIVKTSTITSVSMINFHFAEAVYYLNVGKLSEAFQSYEKGLRFAQGEGIQILKVHFLQSGTMISLDREDLELAKTLQDDLRSIIANYPGTLDALFYFHEGWLMLAQGNLAEAKQHAEHATEIAEKNCWWHSECWCRLLLARINYEKGDSGNLKEQLKRLHSLISQYPCPLVEFHWALVQSFITINEPEQSSKYLRQGLQLGKKHQFFPCMVLLKRDLSLLCAQALEWGIEIDYVQQLIQTRELEPNQNGAATIHWPWNIKVSTLGRFAVEIEGESINVSRKAQRRPLTFLKALVALGGNDIPETQISDFLWPDAEGDAAHQTFGITLHRVRKLLGRDEVIEKRHRKVTLNPTVCWVDAQVFEDFIEQAETSEIAHDPQKQAHYWEQAINLYQGPFLPEDRDEPWTFQKRERLSLKYQRAVKKLSEYYLQEGQNSQAIDVLENAIAIEPNAEPLYATLMETLQHLNHSSEAMAVYQRCQQALKHGLNKRPSAALRKLQASLK